MKEPYYLTAMRYYQTLTVLVIREHQHSGMVRWKHTANLDSLLGNTDYVCSGSRATDRPHDTYLDRKLCWLPEPRNRSRRELEFMGTVLRR